MKENESEAFRQLKKKVEKRFRLSFPENTRDMEDWSGQDIVSFQEDLAEKVNGRISEKWFYTHIKNESGEKIPRIDILNLLSRYTGYADWTDFKNKEFSQLLTESKKGGKKKPVKLILIGGILLMLPLSYMIMKPENKTYKLCFRDAYKGTAITENPVEVLTIKDNESPVIHKSDNKGCLEIEAEDKMKLVIRAKYYRTDTLIRFYKEQNEAEEIKLVPDDYALMIHIFSTGIVDWKKRKQQLNEIIADDAKIFQVYPGKDLGMELYNKEEFIEKLTMPLKSLRNIDILETQYRGNKIVLIRFTQKESDEK
jgi:hypothetical protein